MQIKIPKADAVSLAAGNDTNKFKFVESETVAPDTTQTIVVNESGEHYAMLSANGEFMGEDQHTGDVEAVEIHKQNEY